MFESLKTGTVIITLCIPFFGMTFWAVIDAAQREFGTLGRKTAWMFVAAIPFVGFIIYFAVGRWKGKREEEI
jgi:hypothetical protein